MSPKSKRRRAKRRKKGKERKKGGKKKKRRKREEKREKKKKKKEGTSEYGSENRRVDEARSRASEPPIFRKIVPFYDLLDTF